MQAGSRHQRDGHGARCFPGSMSLRLGHDSEPRVRSARTRAYSAASANGAGSGSEERLQEPLALGERRRAPAPASHGRSRGSFADRRQAPRAGRRFAGGRAPSRSCRAPPRSRREAAAPSAAPRSRRRRSSTRAAQEAKLREQPEAAHHPRPEILLLQVPGALVAAGEQRRREVELELAPSSANSSRELPLERAVGVEPRHLVFVLDRHQLEERMRDLDRERRLARRDALAPPPRSARPALCSARHRRRSDSPSGTRRAARRSRRGRRLRRLGRSARRALRRGEIERRAAAPFEGRDVHLHLDAVQPDRLQDRRAR